MEEMIPILIATIASIASFAVSGIASFLTSMALQKRKTITVTDNNGRVEEVSIPLRSSEREVQQYILEAKDFERRVGIILKQQIDLAGKDLPIVLATQSGPDFVILGKMKFGFEVKTRLLRDSRSIRRMLGESIDLDHLFLILKDRPSDRSLSNIRDLVENGKITVISGDQEDLLASNLSSAVKAL